ncbi:hypothetical protein GGTG_06083 [Gaeumannomyces tritici R3-111a-1]|uniref:Uncharacterized protein n=1 Tax=Gaeumannomyces tritici (strain R3-111a-1) TaxID=644352 RepID=J3NXS8_GAET3|nr:hypothetical protein GGTG_06083 [Gaeumannomyces tritici R3-111a-1]EJT76161.1 hypothetical protein GGTG_06083 [Gaeumannomyces tritici R3-111a-1]
MTRGLAPPGRAAHFTAAHGPTGLCLMHYSEIASIMALAALAAPAAALPTGRGAALEARYIGPHTAVGPYISRNIKKTHNRVKAHNNTVKNNQIKDPEMASTSGKPAQKPAAEPKPATPPKKDSKRDVQPEEAEEEAEEAGVEEEAAGETY